MNDVIRTATVNIKLDVVTISANMASMTSTLAFIQASQQAFQ